MADLTKQQYEDLVRSSGISPLAGSLNTYSLGPRRFQQIYGKTAAEDIYREIGGAPAENPSGLPDLPPISNAAKKDDLYGTGYDISQLIAASEPAINRADLEAQLRTQYAPKRDVLAKTYEERIASAEGLGAQEKRSLEGQLGTGRRFSTAAQSFIKFTDDENKKKIAALELQRDNALTNFDFELAQVVDKRIQTERQDQQEEFENIFKIINAARTGEADSAAEKKREEELKAPGRDREIADLVLKGENNPAKVISLLKEKGFSATAKEVSDAIDAFSKDLDVDKLTGEVKNFFILNNLKKLPLSISALPQEEQLNGYLKMIKEAQSPPITDYQTLKLEIDRQRLEAGKERSSLLDIIRGITIQNMTEAAPGQVVSAATEYPVKLPLATSELLQRNQQVKEYYIPTLQSMLKDVETGAIVGKVNKYTAKMPVAQYLRNEDLSIFNALAAYFSQQIVYMNSGKQINVEEMKRLEQSLPNQELTISENRKRMTQFSDISKQSLDRFMKINGWKFKETPQFSDTAHNGFNLPGAGGETGGETEYEGYKLPTF